MNALKIRAKIDSAYESGFQSRNYLEVLELLEYHLPNILNFSQSDLDHFVMALAGLEENSLFISLTKENFYRRFLFLVQEFSQKVSPGSGSKRRLADMSMRSRVKINALYKKIILSSFTRK